MINTSIFLYLSPILGLGYAGDFKLHNNKVCISYKDTTYSQKYSFEKNKIESDFYDISNTFIDYFKIYDRKDCIYDCNVSLNLVTSEHLTRSFSNWTTGTIENGKYSMYDSSSRKSLTGLYMYNPSNYGHIIYITDTNNDQYNYGILSHEIAHYWFKRKCFNQGYYNEYYAIMFHEYFMSNYKYFIKNSLLYGERK